MIEPGNFETAAIEVKEQRIRLFRRECMLSSIAVLNSAVAWLAELWGPDVSTQQINRRALIWDTFPMGNILPDISLSLYGGALEAAKDTDGVPNTDEAIAWLALAMENNWSRRDLLDAADILKGKHLSSCKFAGEVEVTEREPATGRFAVINLPISGDRPAGLARVTVCEVLDKGEETG